MILIREVKLTIVVPTKAQGEYAVSLFKVAFNKIFTRQICFVDSVQLRREMQVKFKRNEPVTVKIFFTDLSYSVCNVILTPRPWCH